MTNKDVLKRGIPEEIEQMMYYLLFDYWENLKEYKLDGRSESPINLVTEYKNFLKQETLIETEIYDKYHLIKEDNIIDVEFPDNER